MPDHTCTTALSCSCLAGYPVVTQGASLYISNSPTAAQAMKDNSMSTQYSGGAGGRAHETGRREQEDAETGGGKRKGGT